MKEVNVLYRSLTGNRTANIAFPVLSGGSADTFEKILNNDGKVQFSLQETIDPYVIILLFGQSIGTFG